MPETKISKELTSEYTKRLEGLLDEQDDVAEKKSRVTKALGGELKIIASEIHRVRRVLKGLDSPQQEIPGTELGDRRPDPGVAAILKAAARVQVRERRAKGEEEGADA
jgi:hypothetical protein